MLVSPPSVNPHQLTNNLISSNTLHSLLPSSYSTSSSSSLTSSNPCTWSIKQVEEWLIKHDLHDCIDLICNQHRMNGQRLINLQEDDVLFLRGTTKNNELWLEIKELQRLYSSNYNLWTQRPSIQQQQRQQLHHSLPTGSSSYLSSTSVTTSSMPLRPIQPLTQICSTPSPLVFSSAPVLSTQSKSSSSSSSSSYTTIQLNQNVEQDRQQITSSTASSTNPIQIATPTALIPERSSLTVTRTKNHQQYQRRAGRSLSTSSTSINLLPPTTTSERTTNSPLNLHYTPTDQIEDQSTTSCCFIGSVRSDKKKTLAAFLLALCTLYFCSFMITIVDERLPDPRKFRPLPDLVLDHVKQIPWAFFVTEKIILIEIATLVTIIVLHRHR